ncbi:MAG TPA: hypothetical protein VNT79_15415 [Phycisphaerae bacterium]|nr:hypothetical protein [Phycisphaerae bacterium]
MGIKDVSLPQPGESYRPTDQSGYGIPQELLDQSNALLDAAYDALSRQRAANADLKSSTAVYRSGTDAVSAALDLFKQLMPLMNAALTAKPSVVAPAHAQMGGLLAHVSQLGNMLDKARNVMNLLGQLHKRP